VAIAFDAFTASGSALGASLSFTHTPVGTPRGVLILHAQQPGTTTEVTAVTYGGATVSPVALSPQQVLAGNEDGVVYGFFLGSSIPTGAQTVAVTTNGTGSPNRCGVITVTAAADTTVEDTSVLDQVVANPSVTLDTAGGLECFVAALLFSGQNTTVAVGGDYTSLALHDFTSQVASWMRRTNNSTGGSVTVNWTASSEDAGIMAVAIKEVGAAGSVVPVLMPQYRARWGA
jgi:hypothetical protein